MNPAPVDDLAGLREALRRERLFHRSMLNHAANRPEIMALVRAAEEASTLKFNLLADQAAA
jgi:hypothetical protein